MIRRNILPMEGNDMNLTLTDAQRKSFETSFPRIIDRRLAWYQKAIMRIYPALLRGGQDCNLRVTIHKL
jgi:hypothetical protein